jgi:hypothetical protein
LIIDLRKYFNPIWSFLQYWLLKEDRYSLQGRYISDLYTALLNHLKDSQEKNLESEDWEDTLLREGEVFKFKYCKACSKNQKKYHFRKTKARNRHIATDRKLKKLYQYFWLQTPKMHVLVLNACKGLSTVYVSRTIKDELLASEREKIHIKKAEQGPGSNKTHYGYGNIPEIFPLVLQHIPKLDFVLINVTLDYQAVTGYFQDLLPYLMEGSIVAIANIHCSKDMEKAWKSIRQTESVSLSIDFFECGILIFKKGITKGHFILDV